MPKGPAIDLRAALARLGNVLERALGGGRVPAPVPVQRPREQRAPKRG